MSRPRLSPRQSALPLIFVLIQPSEGPLPVRRLKCNRSPTSFTSSTWPQAARPMPHALFGISCGPRFATSPHAKPWPAPSLRLQQLCQEGLEERRHHGLLRAAHQAHARPAPLQAQLAIDVEPVAGRASEALRARRTEDVGNLGLRQLK